MDQPSLRHRLRERTKAFLRTLFELGQRCGVDVLPRHFYSEIPDIHALRKSEAWRRPREMVGVAGADLDEQLEFLRQICAPCRPEIEAGRILEIGCQQAGPGGFGSIEAEVIYCFVRSLRPKRIVQVGCGVTTAIMLRALAEAQVRADVVCIDPFPTDYLKKLGAGGEITLIPRKAQDVEPTVFASLGDGDLLFVDSTHAIGAGSEVNRLILDVIPRLQSGCYIHFHDIYFPYDYAPHLLDGNLFFWNETALLMALLVDNPRLRIRISMSMLHYGRAEQLKKVLPNYNPRNQPQGLVDGSDGHFPSSTYLQRQ